MRHNSAQPLSIMRSVIARPTRQSAEDLLYAIDQVLGLPQDAVSRGSKCQPPPFGRTETWSSVQEDGPGRYLVDTPPEHTDGLTVQVRGAPVTIDRSEAEQAP